MTTEYLWVSVIMTVFAAAVGFLFAVMQGRKAVARVQERLAVVQANNLQLEQHLSELGQSSAETTKKLHLVELGQERLQAQLELVRSRKMELDQQLKQAQVSAQTCQQTNVELGKQAKEHEVKSRELRQQLDDAKQLQLDLLTKCEGVQVRYAALNNDHTELKTCLEERESGHAKQLENFEEQKQLLEKVFENMANKIFEEKGKAFSETSSSAIHSLLKPFREQIDGFQKRVNEVHADSIRGHATLDSEIKKVLDVGLKMRDEASNLAAALKGDKKALGNWSEVQVELLLEMSGLHKGREYQREANYKTEEGRSQRPDFIINLPNDKQIIVDSKMSLNAYVSATAAQTEEKRQLHMKSHVEAIRKHVKELSDKNYPKLKGINSPEYVFMFMGNEPAYLAAFNHEPNLFQEAYRKGIAIVTPNTLLSSLRIVSHLWSIDKQNSNTRELAEQASKVYDKLRVFVGKMEKLGSQINTVNKTYQESWATLKDGNGSLTKQVGKFVEMGVSVKEKLPVSVTPESDIELLMAEAERTEINRQEPVEE